MTDPSTDPALGSRPQANVTNLELRESNPDGSEGAGLSHTAGGMFLLHVLELAAYGELSGCATILHDVGDHGGRYLDLAHVLAADGWAVALPDLRGHGRSEGARGHSWGWLEVRRDLDAVLDHLAYQMPSMPQVLIGTGLGATQALAYAIERPGRVEAVVACGPLLAPSFRLPEKKGGLLGVFKKVGPESEGETGWSPDQRTGDAAEARSFDADELTHDVVTLRAGEMAAEAAAKVAAGLAGLATPVLVVHGADDPLAPPEGSRAAARDGIEVRVRPGERHDLFHDTGRDAVMADVRAWLGERIA